MDPPPRRPGYGSARALIMVAALAAVLWWLISDMCYPFAIVLAAAFAAALVLARLERR